MVEPYGLGERGRGERRVGEQRVALVGLACQVDERGPDGELDGLRTGHEERVELGGDLCVVERSAVDGGIEELRKEAGGHRAIAAGQADQAVELAEDRGHGVRVRRRRSALARLACDRVVQQSTNAIGIVGRHTDFARRELRGHLTRIVVEGIERAPLEERQEHVGRDRANRRRVVVRCLAGVVGRQHSPAEPVLRRIELGEGEVHRRLAEQHLIRGLTPPHREAHGVGTGLPDGIETGERPGVELLRVVHRVVRAELGVRGAGVEHLLVAERVVAHGHRVTLRPTRATHR